MKSFSYLRPKSVEEALMFLQRHGGQARIIAGGTDLIVKMKRRILGPQFLIDIASVRELRKIEFNKSKEELSIGAAACLSEIVNHPLVCSKFTMIAEAAGMIASVQIRNLATIGGNICNASPAADLLPPLIAMKGKVNVVTPKGAYQKDLEHFFKGPGETILEMSEIVTHVQVPMPSSLMEGIYLREGRVKGMDLAIAGVAVAICMNGKKCEDISIVLGSVAPTPMRVRSAEDMLKGKEMNADFIEEASKICRRSCRPVSDIRGSAGYRRKIVQVLTQRALEKLLETKMIR